MLKDNKNEYFDSDFVDVVGGKHPYAFLMHIGDGI
jgi:hypothetical protein